MALAHHVLASARFREVTNARVNGDGGLDVGAMTLPALLAATVGLGWSKDNLRTADRCYVNGTFPNGTVEWPCGAANHGERTSGLFEMQLQQTLFAALSLGPVGLSDQLTARPDDPAGARITTNATLAMATVAATGDLLQPSYPLVPLDRTLVAARGSALPNSVQLWGTYTALAADASRVWYTAMGSGPSRMKLRPPPLSLQVHRDGVLPQLPGRRPRQRDRRRGRPRADGRRVRRLALVRRRALGRVRGQRLAL